MHGISPVPIHPPTNHLAESDGEARRVFCMSNPAIFTVNEVTIGITTNDILFHLSGDEVRCLASLALPCARSTHMYTHTRHAHALTHHQTLPSIPQRR